jgi:hypothetical protein
MSDALDTLMRRLLEADIAGKRSLLEARGDSPPMIKLISGDRRAVFRGRTWFRW